MLHLSSEKSFGATHRFLPRLLRRGEKTWSYVVQTPTLWIPLVILIGATLVFRFTNADVVISRPFHDFSPSPKTPWPLGYEQPWHWLYRFGVLPGWFLGVGGLAITVAGCFWSKLRQYRDAGLFFALMLALGPGLLINSVLKPYWGRPRPHRTIPFGGPSEFLPVWSKGEGAENLSFPSGHASMGFYLMAPAFVLYRRRPRWATAFLCLGLGCGALMGLTRIVAGSHFASDVLWSAGIVYFTGLGLSALFRFGERSEARDQGPEIGTPRSAASYRQSTNPHPEN
jgi:lipid A 4'-phosphatase